MSIKIFLFLFQSHRFFDTKGLQYLINKQKGYGLMLKKIKYTNPNFIFGIAGCMSQEEVIVKRILQNHEHVDFILGTHNIFRLPQIIEQAIFSKETIVEICNKEGDVIENLPSIRNSKIKA